MAASILNRKTVAALCLAASVWVKQDGKWVTVVHSETKARWLRLTMLFSMSFSTVCDGAARTLCLTGLFLCSCASLSPPVAFEGNPMPATQVATYLEVLTPSAAYDTPPKFLDGYAPFYPENEAKKNELGYALLEFNVRRMAQREIFAAYERRAMLLQTRQSLPYGSGGSSQRGRMGTRSPCV
jgi:hypothetical protein